MANRPAARRNSQHFRGIPVPPLSAQPLLASVQLPEPLAEGSTVDPLNGNCL